MPISKQALADIKLLQQKNRSTVMAAVNRLSACHEAAPALISVIEQWEHDETYAPVWAIVILGAQRSVAAIPALLNIFYSDEDFLCEAAQTALRQIAKKYPEQVFSLASAWIEDVVAQLETAGSEALWRRLDRQFSGRIYAYSVIASLSPLKAARLFLTRLTERDYTMAEIIVGDLLRWPLSPAFTAFFRRQAALAEASGGTKRNRSFVETKWALIYVAQGEVGEKYPYYNDEAERDALPWTEQWQHVLDEFEDQQTAAAAAPPDNPDKTEKFLLEIEQDRKLFEEFVLPPFNASDYFSVRVRSPEEQQCQDLLDYIGLGSKITVEEIQVRISRSQLPSAALSFLDEFDYEFADHNLAKKFFDHFLKLWNITPREEFCGLAPAERQNGPGAGRSQTIDHTPFKVGRNEPCYCGATDANGNPVKFKRCHGA